jgi:hypothetical protein
MPVTVTTTTQTQPITDSNFASSLHTAMVNAGFSSSPHSYTTSTETRRVYFETVNSDTYGTGIVETRIVTASTNNRQFTLAAYTSFNTSTNSGSGMVTSSTTFTPATNSDLIYHAINGGVEFRQVIVRQGTNVWWITRLRPSLLRPSWWNDNAYPYWFIQNNLASFNSYNVVGGASLSPWNDFYAVYTNRNINGVTPGNLREIRTGLELEPLVAGGNKGLIGVLSDDFGTANTTSLTPGVSTLVVNPGTDEWIVLAAGNASWVARII